MSEFSSKFMSLVEPVQEMPISGGEGIHVGRLARQSERGYEQLNHYV
jgi:hypothetical protein